MDHFNVNVSGDAEFPSRVRALVVGQPGVGKTDLGTRFPNPLFVHAGSNLTTLAQIGDIPYVTFGAEKDLHNVKVALDRSAEEREALFGRPIDTLVIDTVDQIQRIMMAGRLARENRTDPEYTDWNWIANRLHAIFDTLYKLDVNLVILAHTKDVNIDPDRISFKPALAGAFCDGVHEYVDYSLLLHAQPAVAELVVNGDASAEESDLEVHLDGIPTILPYFGEVQESTTITRRTLHAAPRVEAEWVSDKTGTLPASIDVDDDDFFALLDVRPALVRSAMIEVDISKPVEAPPTAEEVVAEANGDITTEPSEYTCTNCATQFTEKTWADLSSMRFKEILCGTCYKEKDK
jgi:hypothetical protein